MTRSQAVHVVFLRGYQGYLQADAFPGYDGLYRKGDVREVACWAQARRKFVNVAGLMKTPGGAQIATAFIKSSIRLNGK